MIQSFPVELCDTILKYAATPNFHHDDPQSMNPYSSALALCLVSKTIRFLVIPELLRTIFLPGYDHVVAFTDALQMQRAYARKGSHLHVDYAAQVQSIWIAKKVEIRFKCGTHRKLNNSPRRRGGKSIDFNLLAPVVLASKSLQVDYDFMFLLDNCLEYAWNARINSNIHHKSAPLPWSVETLTLCGGSLSTYYGATRHHFGRYSFFGSISHILVREYLSPTESVGVEKTFHYKTPECSYDIPWACLKNLRLISFGIPHEHLAQPGAVPRHVECGKDMHVELLTVPDPTNLPLDRPAEQTSSAYSLNQDGRISSVDCRATVTCTKTVPHDEPTCLMADVQLCRGVKF